MSVLTKLLSSKAFIATNKVIARGCGLYEAILLAELCHLQDFFNESNGLDNEGYFYRTAIDLELETTLSEKVQKQPLERLKSLGFIKMRLKGMPAKKHFKVDDECELNIMKAMQEWVSVDFTVSTKSRNKNSPKVETSFDQKDEHVSTISTNMFRPKGVIYKKEIKEENTRNEDNTSSQKILTNFSDSEILEKPVAAEKEKKEKKVAAKKEKKTPDPATRPHLHDGFIKIYEEMHEQLTKTKIPNTKWKQQVRGIEGLRIAIIESAENFRKDNNHAMPTDDEILSTFRNFVRKAWLVSDAYNQGQFSPNHLNNNFISFTNKIRNNNNGKANNNQSDKLTVEQRETLNMYKPSKPVFTSTDFTPTNFGNVG